YSSELLSSTWRRSPTATLLPYTTLFRSGAERRLGTTPIAIAFPAYTNPPIVIDLATSVVAFGKVEIANRQKKPIPLGWIIDEKGDRKSTRLNSSHVKISYAVFGLKKKTA